MTVSWSVFLKYSSLRISTWSPRVYSNLCCFHSSVEQNLSQDYSTNHCIAVQFLFWFQKEFLQSSLIQNSSPYSKIRTSVCAIALWLQAVLHSWDFGISARIYFCDNASLWKNPQEIHQKENQEKSSFLCQPISKESGSICFLARNRHIDYLANQRTFSEPFPFWEMGDSTRSAVKCLSAGYRTFSRILCLKGEKYPISTIAETRLLFPGQTFGIITFPQVLSIFTFSLTIVFAEDKAEEKLEEHLNELQVKTSALNIFDVVLKCSALSCWVDLLKPSPAHFPTVYILLWLSIPCGITPIYYTAECYLGIRSCLIPQRICQRSVAIFMIINGLFPSSDMAKSVTLRMWGGDVPIILLHICFPEG